jgi:hypothetical protein
VKPHVRELSTLDTTIRVTLEEVRASLEDRLEPETLKDAGQSIRADLREPAQRKQRYSELFLVPPLCGVRIHSDRLEAGRACVRRRNLGSFVAAHRNRERDRVARHRKRVLDAFAEGMNLWKGWNNHLEGVVVRFEHDGIAHIHDYRVRRRGGPSCPE